jgi:hypothetical protein
MSALANLNFSTYDAMQESVTSLAVKPIRSRNGVFEFAVTSSSDTVLAIGSVPVAVSASVRAGKAADFVYNTPRVKRKSVIKIRLPITTPGVDGDIIDYIDVETSIAAPVEATEAQIVTAMLNMSELYINNQCLYELCVNGAEPY